METSPRQDSTNFQNSEKLQGKEFFDSLTAVEWVSRQGVEVKNPEQLARLAEVLVHEFEIEPGVLLERRNRLLLVAIANELGDESLGEAEAKAKAKGSSVSDMIALAFGKKTCFKDEFHKLTHGYGQVAGEMGAMSLEYRTRTAYETLTNPEVTADLNKYIQTNDDFAALRQRLGVTLETQAPFKLRVLNIGNDSTMYGWQPGVDWLNAPDDRALAQHEAQTARAQELRDNEARLIAEIGVEPDHGLAPAWVNTDSEGSMTLCVPLPTAEKLLHQNVERASYYDKRAGAAENQAVLLHEFTHTQSRVVRGDHIGLGIALEELRAEHFSGDLHGYTEIKRYFSSIQAIYGYSPKDFFESGEAYDADDFEIDIARNLGLEGYLDAMTVMPLAYSKDPTANVFMKRLAQSNGGIDEHFSRMYDRAIAKYGEEEVSGRIGNFVDRVVFYYKTLKSPVIGVEDILTYQRPSGFTQRAVSDFRLRYSG